jgi:aryl-alcohol dehydrogenase-like predicted oxidoreductase
MTIETTAIERLSTPVSRIGLGTWEIAERMWGGTDEEDSNKVIRQRSRLCAQSKIAATPLKHGLDV